MVLIFDGVETAGNEMRKEMVKQTDRQRNGSGMLRARGDFRRN